jgi:2-haloacid dehalogenase
MKYKWLLFDADGTLFDFNTASQQALRNTFTHYNLAYDPDYWHLFQRINEQMWLKFEQGKINSAVLRSRRFEQLLDSLNLNTNPAPISETYLIQLAKGTHLVEGAEAIIHQLYEKVELVIITNGLKDVQKPRLARSTIGRYFADMIISDDVGAAKPSREIFDIAFRRMNDPDKGDVLIIGDSLSSDIKGGSDYGIDTCWFNPDRRICDLDIQINYEVTRLSDILNIVQAT